MQHKHKMHFDVHVHICGNRGKGLLKRWLGHEALHVSQRREDLTPGPEMKKQPCASGEDTKDA